MFRFTLRMMAFIVITGHLILGGVTQPANTDPPRFVTRRVIATVSSDVANTSSCPQLPYSSGESASSSGSGSTSGSGSGQCPVSTNELLCSICESTLANYSYKCTLLPEVCALCYRSNCDSGVLPTRCERLIATYGAVCDQLLLQPECRPTTVTQLNDICYELRNTCPDFSSSSSGSTSGSRSASGDFSGSASGSASGDISGSTSTSGSASGDISGSASTSGSASGDISGSASTSGSASGVSGSASGDISGSASTSGSASGDISGSASTSGSASGVSGSASGDISGSASTSGSASGDISGSVSTSGSASGVSGSASGDISGSASTSGSASGSTSGDFSGSTSGASGIISGSTSTSSSGSSDFSGSTSGSVSGDFSGSASGVSGSASTDFSSSTSVSGDLSASGIGLSGSSLSRNEVKHSVDSTSGEVSSDQCSDVTNLLCQLCEPFFEKRVDCSFSPERCMLCSNVELVCSGSGSESASGSSDSVRQCHFVVQTYAPLCQPLYMYQSLLECEFPTELVEFCSSIADCFVATGNNSLNCTSLNAQYDPLCFTALQDPSCEFTYSPGVCSRCNVISTSCSPLDTQLNTFCAVESNCRKTLASCFNESGTDVECVYCAYFADNCRQEELCEIRSLVEECYSILNTGYPCECFFTTVQCDFCRKVNSTCNLPLSTETTSATTVETTQGVTTQFTSPVTTETTQGITTQFTSPVTTETTQGITTQFTSPVTTETTQGVTTQFTSPVTTETTQGITTQFTSPVTTETTQFTFPVTTETPSVTANVDDLSEEEKENAVTTELGGLKEEDFTADGVDAFRDSVADIVNKIDGDNRRKRQSNGVSVTAADVIIVSPSPFTSPEGNLVIVYLVLQSDGTPVDGGVLSLAVENDGEQLANSVGDALNIMVSFVGVSQGLPDSFQQTPPPPTDGARGLSPGAIVGIVIAILVVLCLLVIVIITVLLYFGSTRRKYELGTAYGNDYVTNAETFSNPVYTDIKTSKEYTAPTVGVDVSYVAANVETTEKELEDTEATSQSKDEKSPKQGLAEEDKNTHL